LTESWLKVRGTVCSIVCGVAPPVAVLGVQVEDNVVPVVPAVEADFDA
jgi:hypothetical protein